MTLQQLKGCKVWNEVCERGTYYLPMEGILNGYTTFLSKMVYEMVSTLPPWLWTEQNNCNIYLILSVTWPKLNKLKWMVFLADKQWNPLRFVLILYRTKPYTIYRTSKKGKWLTSSLFQRIIEFFLHLIKWGIKVNCCFLQNRAGVPLKSCACGIARTKVITVFFSLSYLTFPHFELL